jgi:crotonobetainyl-CoA:carnitine CoA-transferase CaiB-like acyl-CoA transferase
LPTLDGHLVLAVGNDGQFTRFCEAAGHPQLAQDVRFATNPARVQNRAALIPLISEWTRTRSTAAWVDLLGPAAVPCAPILEVAEVMAHPHVAARGMVVPADPASGRPTLVAQPMRFDGQRPASVLPPPALGSTPDARWRSAD